MDAAEARQQFALAVRALAIGTDRLQMRLVDAFLLLKPLLAADTASSDDEEVSAIESRLRALDEEWAAVRDSHDQGQIPVWSISLSQQRAVELAKWVVDSDAALRG